MEDSNIAMLVEQVRGLTKKLDGNGQPGLIDRFHTQETRLTLLWDKVTCHLEEEDTHLEIIRRLESDMSATQSQLRQLLEAQNARQPIDQMVTEMYADYQKRSKETAMREDDAHTFWVRVRNLVVDHLFEIITLALIALIGLK